MLRHPKRRTFAEAPASRTNRKIAALDNDVEVVGSDPAHGCVEWFDYAVARRAKNRGGTPSSRPASKDIARRADLGE
jgi:hypothetical protein